MCINTEGEPQGNYRDILKVAKQLRDCLSGYGFQLSFTLYEIKEVTTGLKDLKSSKHTRVYTDLQQ